MSDFAVTPHINVADPIGFGKTVLMPGVQKGNGF